MSSPMPPVEPTAGSPAEKVKLFPTAPGVYLMKDDQGRVLYVGKAKNLRNRAGHYFTKAAAEDARTSDLVFTAADIIAYTSQTITLLPGDLFLTGTTGGVGDARKPPVYLKDGQVLRTYIEGLGECVNRCVAEKL